MEPSIGELLLSGVKLMLIGMGIVYLFLALLVWVIGVTSKLIQRLSPEPATHFAHPPAPVQAVGGSEESEGELAAAISAAIHYHQNQ